jgi:hypothetical protein
LRRVFAAIDVVVDVGVPAIVDIDVATTPVAITPGVTPCHA